MKEPVGNEAMVAHMLHCNDGMCFDELHIQKPFIFGEVYITFGNSQQFWESNLGINVLDWGEPERAPQYSQRDCIAEVCVHACLLAAMGE